MLAKQGVSQGVHGGPIGGFALPGNHLATVFGRSSARAGFVHDLKASALAQFSSVYMACTRFESLYSIESINSTDMISHST